MIKVLGEIADDPDSALWYTARSFLLGEDGRPQHMMQAYELAKKSKHPDAIWTCKLLDTVDLPLDIMNLRFRFANSLDEEWEDERFMVFGGILLGKANLIKQDCKYYQFIPTRSNNLRDSAKRGDPSACFEMYRRNGSHKYLEYAAKLGNVFAAKRFDCSVKWIAFSLIGVYSYNRSIWDNFVKNLTEKYPNIQGAIYYEISFWMHLSSFVPRYSEKITKFYYYTNDCTRKAVDMWSLTALRIGRTMINADVRKKIAKLIWESRVEGLYLLE